MSKCRPFQDRLRIPAVLGLLVMLLMTACGDNSPTPLPPATSTALPATAVTTTATPNIATTTSTLTTPITTSPAATIASSTFTLNPAEIDTYVGQMMKDYDVTGASLALIQDGKIIYLKGYGTRDANNKTPVTENTLFAIGSATKSFVSLGMMMLVEEGKVQLDDPVIKYLPDFKLADAAATKKLTIRHLLSQTSGLPRADDRWYVKPNMTRQQVVEDMVNIKLTAQPGERWQYCNQNLVLAGYLIEKISGQSWEDFTRQRILSKLGMSSTDFDVLDMQKAPDFALPHALDVLKGQQPIAFYHMTGMAPAGGINASAKDMAQYLSFQLGDGTFNNQKLVSKASLDLMHTSQISISPLAATSAETSPAKATTTVTASATSAAPTPNPTTGPVATAASTAPNTTTPSVDSFANSPTTNQGYALAWLTEDFNGLRLVQHGGNIDGFSATMTMIPATKSGLVLLTNSNSPGAFIEVVRLQLAQKLAGVKAEVDVNAGAQRQLKALEEDNASIEARIQAARTFKATPTDLQALEGQYDMVNGTKGQVSVRPDGRVQFKGPLNGIDLDIELVPYKLDGFIANTMPASGTVVNFKRDKDGSISIYVGGGSAAQLVAQRVTSNATPSEYKDKLGRYSVMLPPNFKATEQGQLVIGQSVNPPGVLVIAAGPTAGREASETITALLKQFDPSFNLGPEKTEVISANGQEWTQLTYKLPGNQTLFAAATKQQTGQKDLTFVLIMQAENEVIPALTPQFKQILESFKFSD
jgi:CubicO group peptidase (beta-lactamase class C family)